MNKIYRIFNKSSNSILVLAPDEERACQIALSDQFVKRIENCDIKELRNDSFGKDGKKSLELILNSGKTGILFKYINGASHFSFGSILETKPKIGTESEWILTEV